ncbi:hypothetical protein GJ699_03460 [Duganella sp. FT80W]|uniref:Uncharacterized protein n=1 Tax=Duganella guangzhouensis TaxID=2666084 RepID=A0A6I2KX90_9BURK|nr:hypothetical protein [Duganella guangzhouensis]MRW89034.1 hypothetical protein [Duganella guangzhouensis]
MQFIAALIEHLVVGLVALLWLLPIANQLTLIPDVKIADHKEVLIAIGLPVAYVVGMYVDVFASLLSSFIKRALDAYGSTWRSKIFGAHLSSKNGKSYERTAKILKQSPDEAARYLLQLSSREKIARGVYLNFLIAAAVNFLLPTSKYYVPPLLLIAMFSIGVLAWLRLNALTDNFKTHW